ncbi:unnamed protein product [Heterobilharzia americana]|nr:unnamed protein product [Heterobilharzia americana]
MENTEHQQQHHHQRPISMMEQLTGSSYTLSDECTPGDIDTSNQQVNQSYSPIILTSIDEINQLSHTSLNDYRSKHSDGKHQNRVKQTTIPEYSKVKVVEIPSNSHTSIHHQQQQQQQQQKENIRRAKSTQSIHSTITAYESLPKTVLNILTTRQSELWTSLLEQQHCLTEKLMKSHVEQLKILTSSENAAVKRCQIDFNNRAAYLSVTLEANQKFVEQEFAEERERMIRFYFSDLSSINSQEMFNFRSKSIQKENSLSNIHSDYTEEIRNNNQIDEEYSSDIVHPVSSVIKKFEQLTTKKGQKFTPINFKPPLSSKLNMIGVKQCQNDNRNNEVGTIL